MNLYKFGLCVLAIFIAISFSLSGVSAGSLFVNESWTNDDIQNALDSDSNIDVLHFQKLDLGFYNGISLLIDRGINIVSDGGVVISGFDNDTYEYFENAFNIIADNVFIKGLSFEQYLSNIINLENVKNVTIVDNIANGDFIGAVGVDGIIISNNTLFSTLMDQSISLINTENVNIFNNNISGGNCIGLDNVSNGNINNNKFSDNDAVVSVGNSNNISVYENNINNADYGISAADSNNVKIYKNNISGRSDNGNGISVEYSKNVDVFENNVDNFSQEGIGVSDSDNVYIHNN